MPPTRPLPRQMDVVTILAATICSSAPRRIVRAARLQDCVHVAKALHSMT